MSNDCLTQSDSKINKEFKMRYLLVLLSSIVIGFFVSGCSSMHESSENPYHALNRTGGYSELALSPTIMRVVYRGNASLDQAAVQELLLKRCAELTLQHNYRYFVVLSSSHNVRHKVIQKDTDITFKHRYMPSLYMQNSMNPSVLAIENAIASENNQLTNMTITPGNAEELSAYTYSAVIKFVKNTKGLNGVLDSNAILGNS